MALLLTMLVLNMNILTYCNCSYFTLNTINTRGPSLLADSKIIVAPKAYHEILPPKFIYYIRSVQYRTIVANHSLFFKQQTQRHLIFNMENWPTNHNNQQKKTQIILLHLDSKPGSSTIILSSLNLLITSIHNCMYKCLENILNLYHALQNQPEI